MFGRKEEDSVAYKLMRASNLDAMIEILIPDNPPRTSSEHGLAEALLLRNIRSCQPNIDSLSAPPEVMYRLVPCAIKPLSLLKAYLGVAAFRLLRGSNKPAFEAVQAAQATAGQFGDDRILVAGGKMAFALLAGLIRLRRQHRYEPMVKTALYCTVEVDKGASPDYHRVHSAAARGLCRSLYTFILDCAVLTGFNRDLGGEIGTIPRPSSNDVRLSASHLDAETKGKLDIQKWLEELRY